MAERQILEALAQELVEPLAGGVARLRRLIPRYRLRPGVLWILLVPVGLGVYILVLQLSTGDGLAPFQSQTVWFRHFAGPFGGVWNGAVAAWDGLRQLVHGEPPPIYFPKAGGDPFGTHRAIEPRFCILQIVLRRNLVVLSLRERGLRVRRPDRTVATMIPGTNRASSVRPIADNLSRISKSQVGWGETGTSSAAATALA